MSERTIFATLASIFFVILLAGLASKRMLFMQAIHARDDDTVYYYVGAMFCSVSAAVFVVAALYN